MLANRSMPASTVIPVLAYPDVTKAADWLCKSFGFTVRLRIANHRAQLNVGADGAIAITEGKGSHSLMVRVEGIDAHYEQAKATGVRTDGPPEDYPYGERQYSAEDLAGNWWTFSESVADVDPQEWGGQPG
jgi:uncharacterized glyoxalase superfamily protein PhnB